jgi:hypothetical protein
VIEFILALRAFQVFFLSPGGSVLISRHRDWNFALAARM